MFQIDLQTQIPPLSNTGKQQIQEGPEWSILHCKSLIESVQVFLYRCHCRWRSNYQEFIIVNITLTVHMASFTYIKIVNAKQLAHIIAITSILLTTSRKYKF
jgi:hypothetical protein